VPPGGERLVVGLVRGVHGLDGTVRVEPLSDDAARFEPGACLFREGSPRRLTVEWSQADAPGLLVRFREVQTREVADRLRGVYLEAIAPAADLGPDQYWWHEVIGVPVTTESGEALGAVDDIFRAGGSEVYVVRGGPRGELLVPAVRSVVLEFAPREGRLVVDAEALGLDEIRPRRRRGRRSSKAGGAAGDGAAEPREADTTELPEAGPGATDLPDGTLGGADAFGPGTDLDRDAAG
jgi:16S rRNA processing protein RimM